MAGDTHARSADRASLRLFVAVTIPEPVADAVEVAFDRWRAAFPQARWTPRSDWHVTLRFLGETSPRLLPWVGSRLGEAVGSTRAFESRVRGVGGFPSARHARVVWAGLDDPAGGFRTLAAAVSRSLELEHDARPFMPHLTVARGDPPVALPASFAATSLESEPFVVGTLLLMRSRLRERAPRYEHLASYDLVRG